MKLNHMITVCAMTAALTLSAGDLFAQDNGNGNGRWRWAADRRGNFDPAQMQQRMMDNIRDQLGFTNDTDWSAVQPLVQKVMDARRDVGFGNMRPHIGRNRGGNNGGGQGGGGRGGECSASPARNKMPCRRPLTMTHRRRKSRDLLAKYKAAQKVKQANLETAQANLKAVLTVKQEAQATLLGLVN